MWLRSDRKDSAAAPQNFQTAFSACIAARAARVAPQTSSGGKAQVASPSRAGYSAALPRSRPLAASAKAFPPGRSVAAQNLQGRVPPANRSSSQFHQAASPSPQVLQPSQAQCHAHCRPLEVLPHLVSNSREVRHARTVQKSAPQLEIYPATAQLPPQLLATLSPHRELHPRNKQDSSAIDLPPPVAIARNSQRLDRYLSTPPREECPTSATCRQAPNQAAKRECEPRAFARNIPQFQ